VDESRRGHFIVSAAYSIPGCHEFSSFAAVMGATGFTRSIAAQAALRVSFWLTPSWLVACGCNARGPEQPAPTISSEAQAVQPPATEVDTIGENRRSAALLDTADAFAKSGNSRIAIDRYAEAIAAAPKRAEGYAHRADALAGIGALDAALKDYRAAVRISPADASLYLMRAKTLLLLRRFDLAKADCNRAVELRPRWGEAYFVRGNIQLENNELDAAIADFEAAIRFMENPASAYNNRGVAHRQKGELDLALADYTAALDASREFADAYNNRGDVYARRGNLDKALADFTEAIRISPNGLQAYENRGDVWLRQSQPERARTDYTTIIDRTVSSSAGGGPNMRPGRKLARVYRKRSASLMSLGRIDDALSDVNEAIDLDPNDSDSFNLRQQLHEKKGQVVEAARDGERADQILLERLRTAHP
jgi:tetratricopeptide (TPR) repeat protein